LGSLHKVASQLTQPQKHGENGQKRLSAEALPDLKKFLPAQLCGV
jgi:hypothetical protein